MLLRLLRRRDLLRHQLLKFRFFIQDRFNRALDQIQTLAQILNRRLGHLLRNFPRYGEYHRSQNTKHQNNRKQQGNPFIYLSCAPSLFHFRSPYNTHGFRKAHNINSWSYLITNRYRKQAQTQAARPGRTITKFPVRRLYVCLQTGNIILSTNEYRNRTARKFLFLQLPKSCPVQESGIEFFRHTLLCPEPLPLFPRFLLRHSTEEAPAVPRYR